VNPDVEAGPWALRDWMSLAKKLARARIGQWYSRDAKRPSRGREALDQALKAQKLPYTKLRGSATSRAGDPRLRLQEDRGLPRAQVGKLVRRDRQQVIIA
jgi:hypothetical protein